MMETGRILHLVASSRGGGAVHVQTLTAALARLGHAVTTVMPLDGGHVEPDDFERSGVRFVALPPPPHSTIRRITDVARILRDEAPLLVHAHGSRAAFWAFGALRWARLAHVHLIYSVHGYVTPAYRAPRRILQGMMERRIARRSSAVVAVARAEYEALLEAGMAPPEKIFTVLYGIDAGAFARPSGAARADARRRLGASMNSFVVLIVCRLDRPRDFHTLLHGFRRVVGAFPHAKLFVVGGGPLRGRIEGLVDELKLGTSVTLWGSRMDVNCFYRSADAFVLTSDGWEGLPISVLEAQAASLPVVVTDVGGSREAIKPDQTGLLVPPRDPRALGSALLHLAQDPARAAAMGEQGRRFVGQQFKIDAMARRIAAIYEARLEASGGQSPSRP